MLFWKKSKSKEIRNTLSTIKSKTKKLKKYEEKKDKTNNKIIYILS